MVGAGGHGTTIRPDRHRVHTAGVALQGVLAAARGEIPHPHHGRVLREHIKSLMECGAAKGLLSLLGKRTHYWRLKPTTLSTEAVLLLGELVWHAYTRGVVQHEFDNPQPPLVSDTGIRFNGVGEQGHETFHFRVPGGDPDQRGWAFQFCKTARKPYDEVVMQVLIVLKHYLGAAITVTSDGDFDDEWADARREIERRYGIRTANGQQLERAAA